MTVTAINFFPLRNVILGELREPLTYESLILLNQLKIAGHKGLFSCTCLIYYRA